MTPRAKQIQWRAILGALELAAIVGLLLMLACACSGCTSVSGAQKTSDRQGPSERREQTGEQEKREQTRDDRGQQQWEGMMKFFDGAGRLVAEATAKMTDVRGAVTTEILATTQPTVTVQTDAGRQVTSDKGPTVITGGSGTVGIGPDGQVKVEKPPVDWSAIIFAASAVLCAIGAGVVTFYWPKKPTLGACLGGVAVFCVAAAKYPMVFAAIVGAAGLIGLLLLVNYLKHRDEKQWRGSLAGVAKLIKEGNYTEAMAALRGSTPEMDQAFEDEKPERLKRHPK